jgi:hemolysin type calcium-binding protein
MEFVEGGRRGDELRGGTGGDELDDFQPSDIDDTDQLFGGENDDFLYAVDGDGNDSLNGGPGADDCYGDPEDTIVNCENESTRTSVSRASGALGPRTASVLLR